MNSLINRLMGLLPCLLLAGFCATAQPYEPDSLILYARAEYDGANALVRWVPHNFETWQWGIDHGYRLERMTIDSAGVPLNTGQMLASRILLDSLLMPLPEAEWEPMSDDDDMAGVAAGMIYGDSMEVISYDQAGFMDVINQNNERANRYGFALFAADNSFSVAVAMGIGYVDSTVLADHKYAYIVTVNDVPSGTVSRRGTASVTTITGQSLPTPSNLEATPGDHSVILTWDKADLTEHYSSYCVEVSYDNGTSFQPAHELPLVFTGEEEANMMFQDSLPANGVTYIYRLKGKSPFGVVGPLSDTIHVVGKPAPLGVFPGIVQVVEATTGSLTIDWEFDPSFENKIVGFDVFRSDRVKGAYTKLNTSQLPVGQRTFVDTDPSYVNYYKVKVEDENGHFMESNAMLGQPNDSIPPAAPMGLVGSSSKSGLVTLKWNSNTEEDLRGYRVFVSNTPLGDFVQASQFIVTDTTFKYQINLEALNEYVYFALRALDFRENASASSAPCAVERPDIIPPSPPSISKVTAEPGKVHFQWERSSSWDVEEYKFQRKPHGVPGWVTLTSFSAQNMEPSYTDSTASLHRYWDYRLLAIDEVGLIGASKTVKAKPVDNGIREPITDYSGSYSGLDYAPITLHWNYITHPDLEGFEIFRAVDNNEKRSHQFISYAEARSQGNPSLGTLLGFVDYDTDFKNVPVQTTYTASNLDHNTVVTGGNVSVSGVNVSITPGSNNVSNNPQMGTTLRYWVVARYMDGAMSPVSGEVVFQLP